MAPAARRAHLAAVADAAHAQLSGASNDRVRLWVPGRIEVLGKHTDYAGGRSLLCAVERGFCVSASPRSDNVVRVLAAATGEQVTARLAADEAVIATGGHWSNYVHTVVRRVARNFAPLAGADIAFASDLPIAAGVSSSSALVTGLFLAIARINTLEGRATFQASIPDADALGGYLGALENGLPFGNLSGERGVGTFGGSEDHTAILRAPANTLVQYRFSPVRFERSVPMPRDHVFVIASSGVRAEKAGSALAAYNRLSTLASTALARWNALSGDAAQSLGDAVAVHGARVVEVLRRDSPEVGERTEQFLVECETIIPNASASLSAGDLTAFGELVDRSMHNAERMLHNQVPQTLFLTRRARSLGALAASAFGAGFGGSVWALVRSETAAAFCEELSRDYAAAFPALAREAEFFETTAGPPAQAL